MSLGGIVSDAVEAGIAGYNGTKGSGTELDSLGSKIKTTQLKDFLTRFSSPNEHVNVLNPKNTFEVIFKFYPTVSYKKTEAKSGKGLDGALKSVQESLLNSAKVAANNALNNLTGGLLNQIMSEKESTSVLQEKANYAYDNGEKYYYEENYRNGGKKESFQSLKSYSYSFIHYLAKANLLTSKTVDYFSSKNNNEFPLELQLGYYVQSIKMPNIKVNEGGKTKVLPTFGEFPVNGLFTQPDNNKITMSILNTKLPLIERIFYPWMKELSLPYWAYQTQPYTTATILVDFNKHTDIQYIFAGCRPTSINLMSAAQQNNQSFIREVEFTFDQMIIKSKLTTKDTVKESIVNATKDFISGAGKMINFNK